MDDKFLYENRPPVRTGFGENLYARISSRPEQPRRASLWPLTMKLALAGLAVFALVMAVSAPARAEVLTWLRQIAGLQIQEMDTLPAGEKEITISPTAVGSYEQIRKDLPYDILFPAYVPGGFSFDDHVEVQGQSIFLTWSNVEQDQILMLVDTDHGQQYLTGKDAAQEIQIDGQFAVLFQGGYDQNHQWDPDQKMLNVLLKRDQLVYWLIYVEHPDGTLDSDAARKELIRMMGSLVAVKEPGK